MQRLNVNIENLLKAPATSDAEDLQRREHGLKVIFAAIVIVSILITPFIIINNITSAASLLVLNLLVVVLWWLTERGFLNLAAFSISVAGFVLMTVFNFVGTGGLHDVAVFGYFMVVVLASYLMGKNAAVLFAGISITGLIVIYLAETNGYLQPYPTNADVTDLAFICAFIILSSILLWITMNNLADSLQRARTNFDQLAVSSKKLQASEESLRKLNDELEQRVHERTDELALANRQNEQLYHMSRAINATTNYQEILFALALELGITPYTIWVTLFDHAPDQIPDSMAVVAQRLAGESAVNALDLRMPFFSIVNDIQQGEWRVLRADETDDEGLHEFMDVRHFKSAVLFPIRLNKQNLGVVGCTCIEDYQFTDAELRLIRAASDLAAPAIDRKQRYDEQLKIADKLREVDTIKSQFLASVSHELRTPLNAILNFTEFVATGMLGDVNEKQVDALDKALNSGRHLLSLINDVLDITKIESGMMKLFVEPNIDLNSELRHVVSATQALIQDKQPPIQWIEQIDADLPKLTVDRRRVRQILLNLLSNAVKFTETGSVTLSVKYQPAQNRILFAVIDTGPGISKKEQPMIFEPFKQSETGIRYAGGTGLGLPIALRLVQAHGGDLWVESDQGKGAAFYFTLPTTSILTPTLVAAG